MAAFGGNAGEMQVGESMSPGRLPAAAVATETSSLEDASFKQAARITVEERREKIHRYIKKRNERNFSKKIKYACRKTLADSRPRVRGRFAKNDDYGEPSSRAMQNHEEYEQIAGMKGEDMLDSDALQAHLSGMNSYMYNHTVESWI
uniref:CCT domain-containing protein n=1 Tax=Arundo donax TaxID=35708 RepID=A0A0A9HK27_ARUDO